MTRPPVEAQLFRGPSHVRPDLTQVHDHLDGLLVGTSCSTGRSERRW